MAPPPMKALMAAIANGRYDHSLDKVGEHIVSSIRKRGEVLNIERAAELSEGDRVRIMGPLRPNYFLNKRGTITSIEDGTVWVKLDKPVRRKGKILGTAGVPARLIEVL
jgi:hypothetical protein